MVKDRLPPVTIGIPFLNAEKTLLDAVRSVFAQTHQDWELILLDDGSTDRSLELAHSIDDPRVRVYSDGENKKLPARLNQLTTMARYEYLARMDADDLMTPDRIERLLAILSKSDQYDLVSCGLFSVGMDDHLYGIRGHADGAYSFEGILEKSQSFVHAGLVARKRWYERNRYDESLIAGEDRELWLRAAKGHDFNALSVSEPLYMYREEGNVTERKLLAAYKVERTKLAFLIENTLSRYTYILSSYARSISVLILSRLGCLDYLLKRRNSIPISDEQKYIFEASCKKIYQTRIPGVDFQ